MGIDNWESKVVDDDDDDDDYNEYACMLRYLHLLR